MTANATPRTSAEHAVLARLLLDEAARIATGEIGFPGRDTPGATELDLQAHRDLIAVAQVHATLALVPEPLDFGFQSTLVAGTLDATIVVGTRVVWMQVRPGRRELLVMSHDTVGTVVAVRDLSADELTNDLPESKVNGRLTQWVRWDDGVVSEHLVDELRVVLGV